MAEIQDIETLARTLANGLSLDQLREQQTSRARGNAKPQLMTEKDLAYWETIFQRRAATPKYQLLVQQMTYESARHKVWDLMQTRAFDISNIECREFKWDLSDGDLLRIKNLIKYFINDPTGDYPLSKGLFLIGMPQVGKTEIMKIMHDFCKQNELQKQFEYTDLSTLHLQTKSDPKFDPITPNLSFNRCFDEFGRHLGTVRAFDPININEALIEERFKRFKSYGQQTHFIANMTTEEAEQSFPPMIFERLRAMCHSVIFKGISKK